MKPRKPRPIVTPHAAKRVHGIPCDTTFVLIEQGENRCQLEIRDLGGSLMIRLYSPSGLVHLCAPFERAPHGECIWPQREIIKESA